MPVLTCGWCGAVLRQADTGRRRRFCDTRCRVTAFRRERDARGSGGGCRPAGGGVRGAGPCPGPRDGLPHTGDYAGSDITPKWGGRQSRG